MLWNVSEFCVLFILGGWFFVGIIGSCLVTGEGVGLLVVGSGGLFVDGDNVVGFIVVGTGVVVIGEGVVVGTGVVVGDGVVVGGGVVADGVVVDGVVNEGVVGTDE